jgi:transcriptional antiterminator RfaH
MDAVSLEMLDDFREGSRLVSNLQPMTGRESRGTAHSLQPISRWYLILTKPSGEETAKVNLERQGYRTYFPRLQQRKLYRGRWVERISALFPRYLFLQLDTGRQSLAPVRSTLGVAATVRFGSEYAIVPATVVDGLIQRADPESGLHELKRPLFEPGAAVRIMSGAFAGLEGIFEREIGEDRVVVLFKLLGREASVRLPAGFVVPAYA